MARVLIADDAAFSRTVLRDMLARLGHEVVGEASDGAFAVELYQDTHPDVMTLDITMPDMNGLQSLDLLMQIDPECRIIICSAIGTDSVIKDALKLGAKDFVVKPVQESALGEAIEKVLRTNPIKADAI